MITLSAQKRNQKLLFGYFFTKKSIWRAKVANLLKMLGDSPKG